MSEKEEENGVTEEATQMAVESEEVQQQQHQESEMVKKPDKMNISLSIWPPTQRTREAIISRLVETLSAPSMLSKRYGCVPAEEAASIARSIEEDAFSTAVAAHSSTPKTADDDGVEILQVYSKDISKRMLEAVKCRATAASPNENPSQGPAATPATSEEISPAKIESS
ncbi:PREDICTED: MFP1 attachment factor 1-like [Nelumbo nucifera]|uniref:MFP1 attachment factor 1-like n=1 Tax=Nelumbo nucifera TaxID=4432 RepID=A0A1U8BBJ9_NELNU|nr:PREDICTED: MFP1 attachment factor 1-like [Nelumbo nucifera]